MYHQQMEDSAIEEEKGCQLTTERSYGFHMEEKLASFQREMAQVYKETGWKYD